MPTTKTPKKPRARTASSASSGKKRSTRSKEVAREVSSSGGRGTRLLLPAVAVLGTGALAAAGFALREELAELMHAAVESLTMTRRTAFPRLLSFAGVERKRSFLSAAMPELGLAVGIASGAALTLWLAPRLRGGAPIAAAGVRATETPPLAPTVHVAV